MLEVQAHALNAHDLDSALSQWTPHAVWVCDGEVLGEGREAVRRGLEHEYGHYTRVATLDGEPVIVEYDAEGKGAPQGLLRFEEEYGRITECRVDHDPRLLRRLPMPDGADDLPPRAD